MSNTFKIVGIIVVINKYTSKILSQDVSMRALFGLKRNHWFYFLLI